MSSERKDLDVICDHLGISHHKGGGGGDVSEVQILKSIVDRIADLKESTHNQRTGDNEASSESREAVLAARLASLPDSLAFPTQRRAQTNLAHNDTLWQQLRRWQDALKQDFSCRRQIMINRLDCTVESFKWKAAKGSSQNDEIHKRYDPARAKLAAEPGVSTSALLAARSKAQQ